MYDITNEKVLQKTAKLVEKYGYERINYSVWIGWQSLNELPELKERLQQLFRKPEASGSRLYTLPIKVSGFRKMKSITGHQPAELAYWLGEQQNLFF